MDRTGGRELTPSRGEAKRLACVLHGRSAMRTANQPARYVAAMQLLACSPAGSADDTIDAPSTSDDSTSVASSTTSGAVESTDDVGVTAPDLPHDSDTDADTDTAQPCAAPLPGVARTPDERFDDLPDYPWPPSYACVDGLRMHYLDVGPPDAEVVLLLHGEPTWSYLYRKMIPIFVDAGYRVIAPDLIGFGRSDKPSERSDYSITFHIDRLEELLVQLAIDDTNVVMQDWGSIIGLRLLGRHPEWFRRVVLANGTLPGAPAFDPSPVDPVPLTGDATNPDIEAPYSPLYDPPPSLELPPFPNWNTWRQWADAVVPFYASIPVQQLTVLPLSDGILAAYDAPFPDETHTAGAHVFPSLASTEAAENAAAWQVLLAFEQPFLTAYGDSDPILGEHHEAFRALVPGAQGQPHRTVVDAGHFVQEDKGEVLAELAVAWFEQN